MKSRCHNYKNLHFVASLMQSATDSTTSAVIDVINDFYKKPLKENA